MKPVKKSITFNTQSNTPKLFAKFCAEKNISFGNGIIELITSSQGKGKKPNFE